MSARSVKTHYFPHLANDSRFYKSACGRRAYFDGGRAWRSGATVELSTAEGAIIDGTNDKRVVSCVTCLRATESAP